MSVYVQLTTELSIRLDVHHVLILHHFSSNLHLFTGFVEIMWKLVTAENMLFQNCLYQDK